MKRSSYLKVLGIIFAITLPLSNPWVRGDGVNYYAYVRSLLVEHDLNFESDWRQANLSFRIYSVNPQGQIAPEFYTSTGHVENEYAVGASILWAPFLVPVHAGMLVLQRLGFNVNGGRLFQTLSCDHGVGDGPVRFCGALSFLPIGQFLRAGAMEFPGHAGHVVCQLSARLHVFHSFLFARALGVCGRTLPLVLEPDSPPRSVIQWIILGLLSGLLLDIYYLNIAILLVPLLESLQGYWRSWRAPGHDWERARSLFLGKRRILRRDPGGFLADAHHAADH